MKIHHFLFFLTGLAALLTVSCTGMNDNIKEYLDQGEINYLGRPASAYVTGGDNRVSINWMVKSDPRIEGYTISWIDANNKKQDVSGTIDRNALKDGYMSGIIDLPEGSYLFSIVHTGQKGYNSIATEVSGNSYGDTYRSMLIPRSITSVTGYADHVEIVWAAADKNVVDLSLTYETAAGGQKTVTVAANETQTNIYDNKPEGKYSYITYFKPEIMALDMFGVSSAEYKFQKVKYKLSKLGWTATAQTSHSWGQGPGALIDDDHGTYWHSAVDASDPNDPRKPFYVEVDMKSIKHILSVVVEKRYDPTEIEVKGSYDGSTWISLGKVTFGSGERVSQTLELDDAFETRYLRVAITGSTYADGRGGIWEVDVLGWD